MRFVADLREKRLTFLERLEGANARGDQSSVAYYATVTATLKLIIDQLAQ
jgi:hypothetical protein